MFGFEDVLLFWPTMISFFIFMMSLPSIVISIENGILPKVNFLYFLPSFMLVSHGMVRFILFVIKNSIKNQLEIEKWEQERKKGA